MRTAVVPMVRPSSTLVFLLSDRLQMTDLPADNVCQIGSATTSGVMLKGRRFACRWAACWRNRWVSHCDASEAGNGVPLLTVRVGFPNGWIGMRSFAGFLRRPRGCSKVSSSQSCLCR